MMSAYSATDSRFELFLNDMLDSGKPFSREWSSVDSTTCAFSRQISRETVSNSSSEEAAAVASPARRTFTPYHSQSVPKSENLQANLMGRPAANQTTTTLMLRNIPNKYTQNSLMEEIDSCGFKATYDFFYLPMDVHNRSNVGYAFINFTDPADAERFRGVFIEHRFQKIHSRKVSSVCCGHVQGLDENLKHFENRAVTHSKNDQYRPVVLQAGERLDFEVAVAEAKSRLAGKGTRAGGSATTMSKAGPSPQSAVDFGERRGTCNRKVTLSAPGYSAIDSSESTQGPRQGAICQMLMMQQAAYLHFSHHAPAEMKLCAPPGLKQPLRPCHDGPAYVQLPAWVAPCGTSSA
mmetsp:Transcript_49725/g.160765  ORF Transcript_49725/g.160765 Transcript_49725/m.160765 type:complete len:350 (-) Transcript_49725:98-1147(-)|eukprot:CAMPEP_0203966296 /NCGR_PEP_ID=MMETSP0359-20131031/95575_1 /ASSEMBLY_ACC=CAM_ASM_000338 /TAXON_ID=268821 /ORGANISM="Scrippsiella Hangoei, Strain SHTV-5" /LENGTH=349 /DNA_ID=CAMNT_0050903629 /DNA_START=83 /DNA_END=1132 /DNA_ORIENTATION=-